MVKKFQSIFFLSFMYTFLNQRRVYMNVSGNKRGANHRYEIILVFGYSLICEMTCSFLNLNKFIYFVCGYLSFLFE